MELTMTILDTPRLRLWQYRETDLEGLPQIRLTPEL